MLHVSRYASSFAYLWLMPRKRILFRCFGTTEHVRPTIWRVATWRSIYAHQQTLSMKNSNFLISTEFEISVQLKLDKTWPSNGRIAGCKQNLREERVWDEKQKLVAVTRRDARSLRGQLQTKCLFRWGLRFHWIPRRTQRPAGLFGCSPMLSGYIFHPPDPFSDNKKKAVHPLSIHQTFFLCSAELDVHRFIDLFVCLVAEFWRIKMLWGSLEFSWNILTILCIRVPPGGREAIKMFTICSNRSRD